MQSRHFFLPAGSMQKYGKNIVSSLLIPKCMYKMLKNYSDSGIEIVCSPFIFVQSF